jgi:hypothetical protein
MWLLIPPRSNGLDIIQRYEPPIPRFCGDADTFVTLHQLGHPGELVTNFKQGAPVDPIGTTQDEFDALLDVISAEEA